MKHNIAFTFKEIAEEAQSCFVWLTDLHLDAAEKPRLDYLFDLIAAHQPDAILIGGDIGNGKAAFTYLERLAHLFKLPFYFVLGNHDYYYSSIHETRGQATDICSKYAHLHYLTDGGIHPLSKTTALVGHDGWSDGRAGDFLHSDVILNDYLLIEELKGLTQEERLAKLNQLGTEAAVAIEEQLTEAFATHERVILLTHTPPFAEASYYGEHPCDDNWAPHFVCQAVGEMLKELMRAHPDKHLLVLCGHTHTGIDRHILPNLRVLSGESILGAPTIQGVIYVE